MEFVVYLLITAFVVVAAVLSLRQGRRNRGKSHEQRRKEVYERYERRMGEFRETEMKERDSSEGK